MVRDDGLLQFTDEHYIALGKLLVSFQSLEHTAAAELTRLINPHPSDFTNALGGFETIVFLELPFKKRMALIRHFLWSIPEADKPNETQRLADFTQYIERLDKAVGMALKAEETRNSLIHSQWIGGGACGIAGNPPELVMRRKFNVHRKPENQPEHYMTPQDILELVERIKMTDRELSESACNVALHVAHTREHGRQ